MIVLMQFHTRYNYSYLRSVRNNLSTYIIVPLIQTFELTAEANRVRSPIRLFRV